MSMSLSQAIRLGSTLGPQGFGGPLSQNRNEPDSLCALEAAAVATGQSVSTWPKIVTNFPEILPHLAKAKCPACQASFSRKLQSELEASQYSATVLIYHLNDLHRWDRLKIADWIESIENTLPIDAPAGAGLEQAVSSK